MAEICKTNHPDKMGTLSAWEWCTSEKKVAILCGSGASPIAFVETKRPLLKKKYKPPNHNRRKFEKKVTFIEKIGIA